MKSIKPGRGPSFMGGVASIAVSVFGVFWTAIAFSMASDFGGLVSVFFPLFGVIFVALGIASAVYNFKNATNKNRYSAFDITEDGEEIDPLNERFGDGALNDNGRGVEARFDGGFCPYCGAAVQSGHAFCKKCGKRME